MRENTKFLWMYVGILFSFALILIVFAGLSTNNDAKHTKGLKSDITQLSQEVTELKNANAELTNQITNITAENEALKLQADTLNAQIASEKAVDDALFAATKAKEVGELEKVKEIIDPMDPLALTELQFYIYNKLIK